jgi:phytoene synthase
LRPAFDALFDVDDAMADVVVHASQPTLAAIKLAWWRERLEELDQGRAPAEPRLQAAAMELLPRGISGADLAELEAGWAALLQENPGAEAALARGGALFRMAGRLLGPDGPQAIELAGQLYAAGSLSRRGLVPTGLRLTKPNARVPRRFRPLSGLGALAARDLVRQEPEATPARAWTLLRHRLTGRF